MANPTRLTWSHDGRNEDGTPFTEEQFAGYQIAINNAPAISIPAVWDIDGSYEMPLSILGLPYGTYAVAIQVVARNGNVSRPSNVATFELRDERVPTAPLGLSAVS